MAETEAPNPQPEHIIDLDDLKPQEHRLIQRGGYIVCRTPGHDHGSRVRPGFSLKQVDGQFVLVRDEIID